LSFLSQIFITPIVAAGSINKTTSGTEYTYTRTNPIIDDSWIGTPKKKTSGNTPLPGTTSQLAGDTQISNGSWILPGKNIETPLPNKNTNTGVTKSENIGNIPLNSAPNNPGTGNIPLTIIVPTGYTTPNGTLFANIPNSYIAPISISSSNGFGSLSVLGPLTYNSITGVFGIMPASGANTGALTATDWNTFNNKESLLTFNN
jgi:hypothetical protein